MKKFRPVHWFGRWTRRQIKQFENWLDDKWWNGVSRDPDFKMDAEKLTEEYPPLRSKIYSHIPKLDELAKLRFFMATRTIPYLKKLGFEGVRGRKYWKQESFEDLELLITDHEGRIKGSITNLEKIIEKQAQRGTITSTEKAKLLVKIRRIAE